MPGITITNGTNQRRQIHYYTNGHPQRLAFLEIEPGQTASLSGESAELKELVDQNAVYGFKEERDASKARLTPAVTYAMSEEEPECAIGTIHRKLYDQEADVHVLEQGRDGEGAEARPSGSEPPVSDPGGKPAPSAEGDAGGDQSRHKPA